MNARNGGVTFCHVLIAGFNPATQNYSYHFFIKILHSLKREEICEQHVMKHFKLTVNASVEPGRTYSQQNLDRLEGEFQKKLMTMDYHGGINLRDETRRRRKGS